jgi:GAF domain-containing protein
MRRRSKASGKLAKARSRRAKTHRGSATEVARLRRELDEAREQQAATADVLKSISRSTFDLKAVLDTLAESAAAVCEALNATIYLRDEDFAIIGAHFGPLGGKPIGTRQALNINWLSGRAVLEARTIHVADLSESDEYPEGKELARRFGHRTTLTVPLLRDQKAIGGICVRRREVRPFTDKQIAQVQNFADQAVIAIENGRLLNELRESLQQQTATSEVLGVISSSPSELTPVFQTMLANATRICEAKFGTLFRFDGKNFHPAAQFNTPTALLEAQTRRGPFQPPPGSQLDRVMRTKRVSHTADVAAEPVHSLAATLAGARSLIAVPMLKDDALIGVIAIYRQEVRPFTDKQIALVQNFANQAVIAIENTRLLNELRQSLEQQTATADVLRIISLSPGKLEPVFQAMLENATRICEAKFGTLFRFDGENFHPVAQFNTPTALL